MRLHIKNGRVIDPASGTREVVLQVAPGAKLTPGGSVTVQRAPRGVRLAVDPWGPVEPSAFALMRALKEEFDARRVLNPGRFVGGL